MSEQPPTWPIWPNSTGHGSSSISADYVFDGTTPPYQTGDIPNPLNYYMKSKLEGENAVRDITDNYAILRIPILYGQVETLAESPVTLLASPTPKTRSLK